MKYETKDIKEEVDFLLLSDAEFEQFNRAYKTGIKKRYYGNAPASADQIKDIKKIILTDGFYRMEFYVKKTE